MHVTHKLDGAGDGWWTGSVRPDLWTPGEWDGVECTADSSRTYLTAFQGRQPMVDWLARRVILGLGVPGVAEADILAGLIDAQPWT